jgi:hypothetical protein
MNIINYANFIKFIWNAQREINVGKGQIRTIRKHENSSLGTERLIINLNDGEEIRLNYADVVIPATTTISDLITLLYGYNNPSAVMSSFSASAGQTVFTLATPLAATTICVIDGSVQSWGYTATAGTYNVVFAAAFSGGEEVLIFSF